MPPATAALPQAIPEGMAGSRFREVTRDRCAEFVAAGHKRSLFFPHRYYCLPKCGPDGFKLAGRMCGPVDPEAAWEIVLYADAAYAAEFPAELFFDDEVVWHRQQFGLPGQLASANLVVAGDRLHSMVHLSDIVQRIGRRREHKTRIENRFKGWVPMLLNAVLNFARERGLSTVYTPTAQFARTHTDPQRNPGPELFERIYDRSILGVFDATREGDWWRLDVGRNGGRIVVPTRQETMRQDERTIAICHDIERGLGHLDVEPEFAAAADPAARASLDAMLAIEAAAGVAATYCVVGSLFAQTRDRIEPHGHALAFHSYDHVVAGDGAHDQLARCRAVDYRVKGYRPPRSLLTADAADENLLFHNFEWLASSRYSLGFDEPRMLRRLAKIPITCDDFALHDAAMPYAQWEHEVLAAIASRRFAAIGLHDCYAPHWLPHYPRFLERVKAMGALKTFDDVAAEVTLRHAF